MVRLVLAIRAGHLLQLWLAFGVFLGEFDLGDGDQDFGARLQVGRFQQRLLFRRAVGRHHRQRIDQRFIGGLFDTFPVGLEIVGLEKIGQRGEQRVAVDRILALARDEIVSERRISDAALPVLCRDLELLFDAEARNTGSSSR